MEGVKGKYFNSLCLVANILVYKFGYVTASAVLFPAVRTCFVSDLQRGLKIQEAKFNLAGTAEVSQLFVCCLPQLPKHLC